MNCPLCRSRFLLYVFTWPIKLVLVLMGSPVQDVDVTSHLKSNLLCMMQHPESLLRSQDSERCSTWKRSDLFYQTALHEFTVWPKTAALNSTSPHLTIRPSEGKWEGDNGGSSRLPTMSTCPLKSQMAGLWSAVVGLTFRDWRRCFLPAGPNLLLLLRG